MNYELMKAAGYGEEVKRVQEGKCPFCSKVIDPKEFRDELSRKEYRISGLCQKCQDEIFGDLDNDN